MAGRGRGRGKTLERLGVQKGEAIPDRAVGPPDDFPPLQFLPLKPPQEKNLAESYLLVIKKEFREHMQNSHFYIQPNLKKPDIERYVDRYQVLASHRGQLNLSWSRFPKELQPVTNVKKSKKRKGSFKSASQAKKHKTKDINISETFAALEQKEALQSTDEVEEEEEEQVEDEEAADEDVDIEEEFEEGTDYVNSYFDNGEDYIVDEDDALEDGGVF